MAEDKDNGAPIEDALAASARTAQSALEDSVKREDKRSAGTQDRVAASLERQHDELEARREPADIGAAGASKMEASGAIIEADAKKLIDVDHPAVDNNPRANTTARQNRVDFNDPSLNDRQAVEQRLGEQE